MSAPYFTSQDGSIVLYHGDCRDVLPQLDPVDHVITDPPYAISATLQEALALFTEEAR